MFLKASGIILASIGILATFQNCGPSLKMGEGGSFSSVQQDVIDRRNLPTGDSIEVMRSLVALNTSIDYSLKAGTNDTGCLTNNQFDACIFWKSPAAAQYVFNGPVIPVLADDQAASVSVLAPHQNFGIRLNTIAPQGVLRNADFDVHYIDVAGSKRALTLTNSQLKQSLATGYSAATAPELRYGTEQIQTFFYLDLLKKMMVAKAGTFFAAAKAIPVNVMSEAAGYNAFYDFQTNKVEVGFREGTDGKQYPLALNAEVVVHEMGHANLHFANLSLAEAVTDFLVLIPCQANGPKKFFVTDVKYARQNEAAVLNAMQAACGHTNIVAGTVQNISYCSSNLGCMPAMDEGQADFFAMVMFARLPSVGELALPQDLVRYWKRRSSVTRENMSQKMSVVYNDDFAKKSVTLPGEIHDIGEIYSEILFDIYMDAGVDKDTFVRTVSEHLRQLTGNSTFVDSKNILMTIDQSMFASRNSAYIRSYFQGRGF